MDKVMLLRLAFGDYYEEYKNYGDDRSRFCEIYDMLIKALKDMENVTNLFIWRHLKIVLSKK